MKTMRADGGVSKDVLAARMAELVRNVVPIGEVPPDALSHSPATTFDIAPRMNNHTAHDYIVG